MRENYYSENYIYEEDAEKASFAYLMSTVVLIVGLPFPIINMIATIIFFIANRKKRYFVRFHCMQSLFSQIPIIIINSIFITWLFSILLGNNEVTNLFIAYGFTALFFNILEFVASLYATVQVRKRKDVRFCFFGELVEKVCKP